MSSGICADDGESIQAQDRFDRCGIRTPKLIGKRISAPHPFCFLQHGVTVCRSFFYLQKFRRITSLGIVFRFLIKRFSPIQPSYIRRYRRKRHLLFFARIFQRSEVFISQVAIGLRFSRRRCREISSRKLSRYLKIKTERLSNPFCSPRFRISESGRSQ